RIDVADFADGIAHQTIDHGATEICGRGDLTGYNHQVGGDKRFARHPAAWRGRQAVIHDGVADLVVHLIVLAHRYRLASEQVWFRAHGKTPAQRGWQWRDQMTLRIIWNAPQHGQLQPS